MLVDKMIQTMTTPGFRFVVAIDGVPLGAFTECVLPTVEWEVEEVKEGGLNTFVHQLPGRRKLSRISLKNGVGVAHDLMAWYLSAFDEKYIRKRVTVTLLNSLLKPVMVWHMDDAYPIKWSGPQLKTDENTVAIQTLELACGQIVAE